MWDDYASDSDGDGCDDCDVAFVYQQLVANGDDDDVNCVDDVDDDDSDYYCYCGCY